MWAEWIAGMGEERAALVRWFLVRMRTTEEMDETVTAMMVAVHLLCLPEGREIADRLAAPGTGGQQ